MMQLIRFVLLSFWRNEHLYRASALTYGTLLSLVPLTMVGIPLLTIFPAFKALSQAAQKYIFEHFIPATGNTILSYLEVFAAHATQLSLTGLAVLVITILFMLLTIEDSLNHVWQVRHKRRAWWRLIMYWVGLSLGPLLIGFSLASRALFAKTPWLEGWVVWAFPYFMVWVAFLLVYTLVPNCKVRLFHSMQGALFAMVFFEWAKMGFQLYLKYFPTYNVIYGAFATIPLFLFWIYIVWVILLLGAEFTYALGVYRQPPWKPERDPFIQAIIALQRLSVQGQKPLTVAEFITADAYTTEEQRKKMLEGLVKAQWVVIDEYENCELGPAYFSQTLPSLQQINV